MMVWLRPQCILAIVTSLCYYSQLVSSKTYDKFYCSTEEGHHHITCPDDSALLTDVSIRKIYRRTQMCEPDVHSEYLIHCQGFVDGSACEGNKTCAIEVSSRNYIQCGEKTYAPTYFFVKYTCTQIHTMCADTTPLRNTLYGFIVSPAYPHPMADNLKCSISIEADPSMYIELAPIQMRLQEAMKCRSEYLEIFGYLNSLTTNASSDDAASERNSKYMWKSYHTWCGADRSTNHPPPNARYLISSNSLYMSLQTAVSKKPRYFKIRYKVVPANARAQYDLDGIAYDTSSGSSHSSPTAVTSVATALSTTIVVPLVEQDSTKKFNGTATAKRTFRKEILIGIIAGVIVLVLAILAGVGIFLFLKRRRSAAGNNTAKKTVASPTPPANPVAKPGVKSSDKAPLLEQSNPAAASTAVAATKRKLVPERTVQIADVNTSRFKPGVGASSAPSKPGPIGKETSSTSSEAVMTSSAPAAAKPALTAADSGIYGADLSDDLPPATKPVAPNTLTLTTTTAANLTPIYGFDLPDKSDLTPTQPPSVSVVVNPLSEDSATPVQEHNTISAIVVPNHITLNPLPEPILFHEGSRLLFNHDHLDETVKSAYSNLIDATISENEGTIGSGSVTSSACPSRRTSNVRQPLLSHGSNNLEGTTRKPTQFNPLHVILKKDANKYYTTEYI